MQISTNGMPARWANQHLVKQQQQQQLQLLLLLLLLGIAVEHASSQYLREVEDYAQDLALQRLFAGMLHVDQGGATVFSKGFGLSSYELGAPMRADHRYPIGSNTKLFTAVAVWQLHRAGKLSVYDAASKYVNTTELGLEGQPTTWCPRVYNGTTTGRPNTGACLQPQIQHLLRMSSGLLGFDNCAYTAGAWQKQYCLGAAKSPANLSFIDYQNMQLGAASIADYLRLTGALKLPLDFKPGSSYHYSNPGYALAGYIVEKVSGMPIAEYFRINIFDKYGLKSTLYDPTNGALGLHKGQLPYPAYITYLQPGEPAAVADTSGATVKQLTAAAGNPRFWGGDVRGSTTNSNNISISSATGSTGVNSKSSTAAPAAAAAAETVSVGMTAKYPGPSGLDWSLANAAGAIVSTPQDMARWFRALLVDPDHAGLGKDLIKEFLALSTDIPGMPLVNVSSRQAGSLSGGSSPGIMHSATLAFAQGLLVMKQPTQRGRSDDSRGLGVSSVYYLGSLGGFQAVVYMWLHPSDPSKDVFINAVAATVLPSRTDWPAAAQNLTSGARCSSRAFKPAVAAPSQPQKAGGSVSTAARNAAAAAAGGSGRHMLAQSTGSSSSSTASIEVAAVLCELNSIVPSAIKTLPDLLARKAFVGLTGREWFDIQQNNS